MFARAFFAAALVAVAAAAPEGRKPELCKDVPVVTVPDVTVVADSKICAPLPAGVCGSGVMVANVTYELNCAFGCPTTTTIWCEGNTVVDEKKKTCASKYWFCCGKDCKGMPEERKCQYDGKEYTVGVAYNLGNGKTMWCVDEETAITCTGKECGSTLELTPPRVETCPVPPKPQPPKPQPQPQCYHNRDCPKVNGLAFECKHGKCVPAEGPFPDDDFSYCRGDFDCPTNYACVNGKCQSPKQCHYNRDCPSVNGVAFECKHNKCVPAEGPNPDNEFSYCRDTFDCPVGSPCVNHQCQAAKPQCHTSRDCPKPLGLAQSCVHGQCVPAQGQLPEIDVGTECKVKEDCNCAHGVACTCHNGKCVPVLGEH